jgi:RHS repeat-associated protein
MHAIENISKDSPGRLHLEWNQSIHFPEEWDGNLVNMPGMWIHITVDEPAPFELNITTDFSGSDTVFAPFLIIDLANSEVSHTFSQTVENPQSNSYYIVICPIDKKYEGMYFFNPWEYLFFLFTYAVRDYSPHPDDHILVEIKEVRPAAPSEPALSSDRNYIHTRTYTDGGGQKYLDQIQYFDGLGRPVQTVQRGITPNTADLVTYQEYDAFGRESNSWLPAVISGNNGAFVSPETVKAGAISSNGGDQKPYSLPVYEASPLNRVLEQYGPGQDWQNNSKAVSTDYKTNIFGDAVLNCKGYKIAGTSHSPLLWQFLNYGTGQLHVTEMKDEDGNTSYEFKDKLGQVVLTRQVNDGQNYDTYYVYNEFGLKYFVLPPKIQDEGISQAKLDELAYQYKYDSRNRCSGSGTHAGYYLPGVDLAAGYKILSANYYDNYKYRGRAGFSNADLKYVLSTSGERYGDDDDIHNHKGLLTGTMTAQLTPDGTVSSSYLYTCLYYDNKKRLIESKSTNHLGGIEEEYIAYNFIGQPIRKTHVHSAAGKTTQTEVYTHIYDHAGRLLKTIHQMADDTTIKSPVVLTENTYDELGRLKTNKKGGQANLNSTYTYNVRSWTSDISSYHFNEALTYSYNGNISSMQWGQAGKTRKYNFTYDNLSRLKTAAYTGESPTNFAASYTYDKHGNIKTLQRYGLTAASTYGIIDNLTAEYTGNQLKYVSDAVDNFALNSSMDFKEYTKGTTTEYTYNKNGAMVKDLNKGISQIHYNSLNLPQMVDIKNKNAEGRNEYTYSASGQKLKAVQKWNPNYNTAPVIGSGINVSSLTMTQTTDYVGNIIYENGNLKRILVDGGYYEGRNYYFYIQDHLGNNRIVTDAAASVVQSTQYYPFGMPFADATGQNVQPYKYNNKELDSRNGLNWYDSNMRYYDFPFPHTPTVDPHAEKYYSWSPYHYAANNPIRITDPTGMDWYRNEDGTAYIWREGSDQTYTHTIGEGDNAINMTMSWIGETYVQMLSDGTKMVWNQQNLESMTEPQSFEQGTMSFMENWSSSNNFFANLSYNILNDAFVSIQPFTFGLIGGKTNEFTGGIAYTNLDGTTNYKGIESFTNTVTWLVPAGEAKLGLTPFKTMNASQFSHTFKGTLSTFSPATRGTINKSMNNSMRFINNQIGSGNAVVFPVSVGSYYKPNNK